uniref:Peptidase M15C domain-containing protein n=1 Tax=Arsenophonus endosymbiont of Trialeurodes vaporariorum TaxID=235567 RepID=A0A3B0MKN2_9GAMM
MSLVDKQNQFTGMVAKLIQFAQSQGYKLTFGEAYRTPAQANINAKNGTGILNSLHTQRLAVDLNLFDKNNNYLTDSNDYQPLGEYWESIGGSWGGRFKTRPDGNHCGLEHNGLH